MSRLPRGGLTGMDALALSAPRRLTVPIDNRWGGGEMAVLDFGDPARPVDLIFAHANGFNAYAYRSLLQPLSGALRIWAPDLRGHGQTRLPARPEGRRCWKDHRDDLIARYGADGQAAKPPTVYRALEFLERRGVVHRIASISAYVACTADALGEDKGHAAAFLICDCCGAAEEVAVQGGDAFARAAAGAGYAIERTTIEGHGRCPACRVAA